MSATTQGEEAPIIPNEGQQIALDRIKQWAGMSPGADAAAARVDALMADDDTGLVDFEAPELEPEAGELALSGAAGTGKTALMRLAKAALPSTTMFAAMTGKAASRLKQAAGISATTLHRILFQPPGAGKADKKGRVDLTFGEIREPTGTAVVIDEASMITPGVYKALQLWRQEYGVRVLYVGDSFQLPPVLSKDEEKAQRAAGAGTDYSVFSVAEVVTLTKVMRNGDAILDAATMLRTTGRLPVDNRKGFALQRPENCINAAIESYLKDPDDHMLITWTNKTRMFANKEIRRRLGITEEMIQPGEPVLVCKNQFGGAVLNGEIYIAKEIYEGETYGPVATIKIITECGKMIVAPSHAFDGTMPYIEDYSEWKRYRRELNDRRVGEPTPVTYGHVLTAHKAQGSQARRVTVFLPSGDTSSKFFQQETILPGGGKAPFGRRFLYTAVTRAIAQCDLLMGL